MPVFENRAFDDHELVIFVRDRPTGLRSIIAIHSTVLGPAGGGVRMYPYASSAAALYDVLRLSRAMTCKGALAGLPVGGGKSVILGDPKTEKSEALLEAFGRAVEGLGGRYVCGEDVGTTPEDLAIIRRSTPYVAGLPDKSGDPSPLTGYGVFQGIRAAARYHLKRDDLEGLKVAIQGAGNVGQQLARHLREVGSRVFLADVDGEALERAVEEFGAERASTHEILFLEADVVAPCALGAVLDDETIPRIQAKIVCGGANNQLADDRHGPALADRGILYVPDYVANAGGLIAGVCQWAGMTQEEATRRVESIYDTCNRVFARAEREGIATSLAAERLAQEIIEAKAAQAGREQVSDASTVRGKGSL